VDATGAINNCGNGSAGGGAGIVVSGLNNLIGGANVGEANEIADNDGPAILMLTSAQGIVITANSTFQNTGVGIQRVGSANVGVAVPTATLVTLLGGGDALFRGNIPACNTPPCNLQVYIADVDNEEGLTFIGNFLLPAGNFAVTVSGIAPGTGQQLVATLTDANGTAEFSGPVLVP
jgi:hypothetical protein